MTWGNPGAGWGNPGGRAAASALSRVLDIDFTTLPTQDLSAGGSFTIGGQTWVTDNHANAATFRVLNGTGLQIFPNATSSSWGRPTAATAPSLKLATIVAALGSGTKVFNVVTRLHLDTSSADAATETAGISLIGTAAAAIAGGAGAGHDGVNPILRGWDDSNPTPFTIPANEAGADAVIGLEHASACTLIYSGDASGGLPSFSAMTLRGNAAHTAAFVLRPTWGDDFDLYLFAESNNVAGNFTPAIKRLVIDFVEADLP